MPKFYFFSQILLSPHAEKKRHEFEKNCRVFFETVFLTFCVTCTVIKCFCLLFDLIDFLNCDQHLLSNQVLGFCWQLLSPHIPQIPQFVSNLKKISALFDVSGPCQKSDEKYDQHDNNQLFSGNSIVGSSKLHNQSNSFTA